MAPRPVNPRDWHFTAEAAERRGNAAEARQLLDRGLAEHPDSAELANSAGSLALRQGDAERAEKLFGRAAELDPSRLEFALNRAIALDRAGKPSASVRFLKSIEPFGSASAKYWSIRASSERTSGQIAAAAQSYDRCLAIEPSHPKGLHGRARVALERGEADAAARFDNALARHNGDASLWLGKAQALDVAGDSDGARQIIDQIVDRIPGWIEGLRFRAQLRLADEEREFADHFRQSAQRLPHDPDIPIEHARLLASVDRPAEAADIVAQARKRFAEDPRFALLEAAYAGTAGELDRADRIFADLPLQDADRMRHECRHRLRGRDYEAAEVLATRAIEIEPDDILAWALRGLTWRLLDDDRAAWLHEQEGLVRSATLQADDDLIERVIPVLHSLHDRSAFPLGQSLRGGTQTRHVLFMRHEPIFAELHQAIQATLERFRDDLPPYDRNHPLLRYRTTQWQIAGSWSVRLTGTSGDHHASHIHPQGMLSSALYLVVPEARDPDSQDGWLEIGRPPPDLRLDLEPLKTIRPERGKLALFPSTLYHGTTPVPDAKRMTVAFDVIPATAI